MIKFKLLILIVFITTSCFFGCRNHEPAQEKSLQTQFKNLLDIQKIPQNKFDLSAFGFSDLGAWHAYSLPHKDSSAYHGAFTGPLLMKMWGQWLAPKGSKLVFSVNNKVDNYLTDSTILTYYPGKLSQILQTAHFKAVRELVFADNRTALIQSTITNTTDKAQTFTWQLESDYFGQEQSFRSLGKSIHVVLPDSSFVCYTFDNDQFTTQADTTHLKVSFVAPLTLQPNETIELKHLESYFFTQKELIEKQDALANYLADPKQVLKENTNRWSTYLAKVLSSPNELMDSALYQKLAVKCIQTLTSNWRSPAGALKHNGVFPSAAYHGFYGFWSWDSWKHVAALSKFNPELAKESMRSMFQFQNKYGMVADCVYYDSTENNWRDTKPPLAAWAVWNIFEQSNDTVFVKEMYPKLTNYHNWWYMHRDANKNGLCEYGSTDGTLIAAKWESGMDNAIRFDKSSLIKSGPEAWSMDQESVDLNVFLQKEKEYLGKLAGVIGKTRDVENFQKSARALVSRINDYFWSAENAYYLDYNFKTKKHIDGFGPEGWLALWTQVADKGKAEAVKNIMMDTARFNTKVPLPTIDASHKDFNPLEGYWRGPVWIDQQWFGIVGLKNYGYLKESEKLRDKFFNNAEGLLSDGPIRENYHPLTGKGLNANHFSWSAAHILLMLTE